MASDPNRLHRAIYSLFDPPDLGRVLFRVDSSTEGPNILIQSQATPNWENLALVETDLRKGPQTKTVEFDLENGRELSFRLLARPSKRTSTGKGGAPGQRRDLRSDEERLDWLIRKSAGAGFKVTGCGLSVFSLPAVHPEKSFREKGGSFSAIRFDGTLVVTDPERLESTVHLGIGIQKGFGLGLLSLGPP